MLPYIAISQVIRSRRRSIGLEITPDARLIIRVPLRARAGVVEDIVDKKQQWIIRKLADARQRQDMSMRHEFREDEIFLFLGREYPLRLVDGTGPVLAFNQSFLLSRHYVSYGRQAFIRWYREQAAQIFPRRLRYFCRMSGQACRRLSIGAARHRWGSCSRGGAIRLNWRLVMAPPEIIDYVIAHETAHLIRQDHSPRFWREVERLYPGHARAGAWLRRNGSTLVFL